MHANSLELFRLHGLPLLRPGDLVLEIGPDWSIPGGQVRPLVEAARCAYHFADIKNPHGGIPMSGPFDIAVSHETYDAVIALNVAEHVTDLFLWLLELQRVTKPGGLLIFVNPTSWPYHESPVDCWRIYPEGWRSLFADFGLEEVFIWNGNVAPLEEHLRAEHGPHQVADTVAIAREPS